MGLVHVAADVGIGCEEISKCVDCTAVELELTAVSQDSLAAISNKGESRGKASSGDGSGEASNSSDGELHFEERVDKIEIIRI